MDRLKVKAKVQWNGKGYFAGDWVEGYYYPNIDDESLLVAIPVIDEMGYAVRVDIVRCDYNTICQCSGLKDSYGTLMFEGDMLEIDNDGCEYMTHIINGVDRDYPAFDTKIDITGGESNNLSFLKAVCADIRVTGNIHD